ncbi:MAG: cobalamin B12-binding domain-containing protein [Chloroflexi bacterium]|nr:cobalamin B12-binding domain-containing protein [Chloroflexota bacterium]
MSKKLIDAIVELKEEESISLAREMIDSGTDPGEMLTMGIEAMGQIGDRFEKGEYFLPELLIAGELMEEINKLVLPLLKEGEGASKGEQVVLGTVSGDVHDIGKNLIAMMLKGSGFQVQDLGISVPTDKFVEAAKETDGIVALGISALITPVLDEMPKVIEAIEGAGIRDRVKIMVGGAPVTQEFADSIGADGTAADGGGAVALAKKLLAE